MKKEIHPKNYRFVVYKDSSCDYSFLTKSTIETKDTIKWEDGKEYRLYNGYSLPSSIKWEDGKEYPLYNLEISDKSHPFFTGKQNLVDTAGRIEKFNLKYKLKADKK